MSFQRTMDKAIKTIDYTSPIVKEAAKYLHVDPDDLEEESTSRGVVQIGNKKTGAIVAKYTLRTGKLVLTGR